MRFTSRKTDTIILSVIALLGALGYVSYAWIYPQWQWHYQTKPRLLASLETVKAPSLETYQLQVRVSANHSITHDGIRVYSTQKLTLDQDSDRLVGDTFEFTVSKNFPETGAEVYFATMLGPLTIEREHIEEASTRKKRALAEQAVLGRELQFGTVLIDGKPVVTGWDRAVLVETPKTLILYTANQKVIMGSVVARDFSDRRDFMLIMKGIDRESAEQVVWHLQLDQPEN